MRTYGEILFGQVTSRWKVFTRKTAPPKYILFYPLSLFLSHFFFFCLQPLKLRQLFLIASANTVPMAKDVHDLVIFPTNFLINFGAPLARIDKHRL